MRRANERALELIEPQRRGAATEVAAGYLDLLDAELASTGATQDLMLTRLVPTIYERWWRPALGRVFKGLTGPGMEQELRIARLLLGLSGGHKVLDVACGPGNFTRSFAGVIGPQGLAVGIDASATMLARGAADTRKTGIENVALIRGDAGELPFLDGSFDAACCFAALHLFAEPTRALAEITRTLRPGGRIALMTSIRRGVAFGPLKPVIERGSGMQLFEPDEVCAALDRLGYTEVHQRISGMVQFVGGRSPGPAGSEPGSAA
jgi:ubiquinone/menaquinone biosynthesis C-methylase UbiE